MRLRQGRCGGCGLDRLGWDEALGGGVILPGPSGDEGPEGGVGGEDAVVSVAVDAGWREDGGETVQELQGGKAEGGAAGGPDADAPIQTEPAAVIPREHVLGFVGFQEVVASELTKDPLSDRVLEALQELGGEGGGFVKAEAVGWGFGVPVWIDPLEDAVHHAKVEVVVRIEGRAEAMEEADGCS